MPAVGHRLPVAGGSLYYEVTGSGPPVVFAHGLGGNHRSWWQQVPLFAEYYTCVTFGHRGFAPSRDATGRPRPPRYADDLTALLDHLGVARAAIVAQSMGGWTAMEFALRAPRRVAALVLCGTTGTLRHAGLATLESSGLDPQVHALVDRGVHPAAGERMARKQPGLHRLYVSIDKLSGTWDRAAVRQSLDAMRVRAVNELQGIRCPVLAVVGEEDVVCPPANVQMTFGGLPSVDIEIVQQAGHSVYFERPATFNDLIRTFLAGTD